MTMTGIYSIENVVNGKKYIGQSVDLVRRKNKHFRTLKSGIHRNIHLQRAFDKYGESAFAFKILLYCEKYELTYYEQAVVNLYMPEDLYNICLECVDSHIGTKRSENTRRKMSMSHRGEKNYNFGEHISEEQKKKLSIANTGHRHSKESIEKMSKSQSGKRHPNCCKHLSEETKIKISESQKRRWNILRLDKSE
jgi:group I intron endonuclease